ncbi:MAG: FkbM family methyltransferase, partial [Pirellulales bacterium]
KFILKEIFNNRTYVRPGYELSESDTVVDVGGNIGMFALWASPQVARVISIEPTHVIDCLEKSIAHNQIKNIDIVRTAVSDQSGNLELLHYPWFNGVTHHTSLTPSFWGQTLIKWRIQF